MLKTKALYMDDIKHLQADDDDEGSKEEDEDK